MMKAMSSYNFEKRRKELSLALPHIKTKSTARDILINAQRKNGCIEKSFSTDPLLCLPVGDIEKNQEIKRIKMAGNQQPKRGDLETQNSNCNTNTTHHNSLINDIKNNIKNKKEKLDALNKELRERKASLTKAKKNVKIQILSIERCKKEIDHHCCQCGGIHVFNNHEPMHRKDCSRLKDKVRSLFYLKQALVEANEKLFKCELDLAEINTNIDKAKEEMTISLSKGLFQMDDLI
ncbi:predicted protein [Chaetoceros tenuissimus]|uniref:Uncharacterized protein n=1 Tax=Chaetoceros tenuissimus TaxID=426638 RepID=A0AAD3HEE3_9STRA|nr:predicted protein [Chaetoceros tenuissimus]